MYGPWRRARAATSMRTSRAGPDSSSEPSATARFPPPRATTTNTRARPSKASRRPAEITWVERTTSSAAAVMRRRGEQAPAHGEQAAARGHGAPDAVLERLQLLLVAPVQTLAAADSAVTVRDVDFVRRNATHLRIREVRDQFVERLGRQLGVGVGEDEDSPGALVNCRVQRPQLANPREVDDQVRARRFAPVPP